MALRSQMEEAEAQIIRHGAIIRDLTLTLIGAAVMLVYTLPLINSFLSQFPNSLVIGDPTTDAIYFGLGIVYTIPASLMFSPKRLISPLTMQLLAWVFGVLTIAPAIAQLHITYYISGQPETSTQYAAIFSTIYFMILMVVGTVQLIIVRWVVGLNGTETDVETQTFSFSMPYKELARILIGRVFRSISVLIVRERRRGHYVILANNPNTTGDRIVIGLSPDPQDKGKSILATACYTRGELSIHKSDEASAYLEANLLFLEKQTGLTRVKRGTDDPLSEKVLAYALRRTHSSLGMLRDVPRYHIFAILFTIALFGVMSLAYFFKIIEETPYVDSLVLIAVAVVLEFGPLVRESLTRRHEETGEEI